tara:strand:+ start:694 stop:879 length:186 start_codon:yes stop_codon:yes gene_type:complete
MRLKITGLSRVIVELHNLLILQGKKGIENPIGHQLLSEFRLELFALLALDNPNVKKALMIV